MAQRRWLKGQTHIHTTYSDGDSPAEVAVQWYAERSFDFIFLTDHNVLIPDAHLAQLQRFGPRVWQGEEVTMASVHVNGIGMRSVLQPPYPGKSAMENQVADGKDVRLRWAVERIEAQGALAIINHPNFMWALTIDDLLAGGEFVMLEVANGHSDVRNEGDATHPSTEALWDRLLAAGKRVWGVASDDAHYFQKWGPEWANPGRGHVFVDAEGESMDAAVAAMRAGRFYGSSGLELSELTLGPNEIAIEIANGPATVELVGPGNAVVDSREGASIRFDLAGTNLAYARARGTAADGQRFWTQPVWR
jgi:hypothetical protein